MSSAGASKNLVGTPERIRDDWLTRLGSLLQQVREWVEAWGWATRAIEKKLEDPDIGTYKAPALLMQQGTTRLLMEPIGRSAAPDTEGIVDLYLMPAYDDVASLYFYGGGWHLHYLFPGSTGAANTREAQGKPLSPEVFREVLEEMIRRGA